IHITRLNQLAGVAVDSQAFGFVRVELLRRSAADGHQLATRHFAGDQVIGVVLADVTHADNAQTSFGHARSLGGLNGKRQKYNQRAPREPIADREVAAITSESKTSPS